MVLAPTQRVGARVLRYDGAARAVREVEVAVEVAVNIVYATVPYAVMMASPGDLEDFVVGFSVTEGVVAEAGEIRAVMIEAQPRGLVATVRLAPAALGRHLARRRSLAGRSGCGICGVESLEQLAGPARPVVAGATIAPVAIGVALAGLAGRQVVNRATGAVHAAAWCDRAGEIVLLREDVGRHNALDKLVGACLRAGIAVGEGFVVLTSRCSYEMVEKTATLGAATLVAISAPTSLALERAAALGITLVAVARADGALAFPAGAR